MNHKILLALVAAALALGAPRAFAQATAAGEKVDNVASVTYEVNGTPQTTPVTNTATFYVDRKVDLSVAELGTAPTTVAPESKNQVLAFTVTNSSNDTIDIVLDAAETSGKTYLGVEPDPTTSDNLVDNKDTGATFTLWVESNSTAGLQTGTGGDTLLPTTGVPTGAEAFLDEVTSGTTKTVYVVADEMPDGATLDDEDVMVVQLTGIAYSAYDDQTDPAKTITAANTLGAILTADSSTADTATTIQNVFADAEDTDTVNGTNDAASNGQDVAYDAFLVGAADIGVTKRSLVIWDPITGLINSAVGSENFPKAIPGAVVLYCITVKNDGGTNATSVKVEDTAPAQTEFLSDSSTLATPDPLSVSTANAIRLGTNDSCTYGNWTAGAVEDTNATDADDTDGSAASEDGSGKVVTVVDTLAGSGGVTTTMFLVKIK